MGHKPEDVWSKRALHMAFSSSERENREWFDLVRIAMDSCVTKEQFAEWLKEKEREIKNSTTRENSHF